MRAPKPVVLVGVLITGFSISFLAACGDGYSTNSGNTTNPPAADMVNISGFVFNPDTLTVKVGTKVTWTNKDNVSHTVTSDDGSFTSSNTMGAGATYSYTFSAVGNYPYHCAFHTYMTGVVTVTQ